MTAPAIALILYLHCVGASPPPPSTCRLPDSTSALRALIDSAARSNGALPPRLASYHARLESEIAIVLRTSTQRENAAQIEQIESTLDWRAPNAVEQHVIGYRSRVLTANVSALSYFRRPWIVPALYGNRLRVLLSHAGPDNDGPSSGTEVAVHPFASDRDAYYAFSGGDTVEVLHTQGRTIPIVRIRVEPRVTPSRRTLLFSGEIDLDGTRHQIVRMHGEFLTAGGSGSLTRRIRGLVLHSVVFAELVNGEFLGEYWLPTYQRLEAQGRSALASEFRPLFRVVTRFREYTIHDSTVDAAVDASISGDAHSSERLTFASRDSLSGFGDWTKEIGTETVEARASDFDDVAPDALRSSGTPRVDWSPERVSDVFGFNRVEGVFSGVSATWRLRDAAPGASVGAHGGYAWAERTVRGEVLAQRNLGRWQFGLRAGRSLANTNDFRPTLDYEASLMAMLVTADDYDYVDRRRATIFGSHAFGANSGTILRIEAGPGSDRAVVSHVKYGLWHADSGFRANRPITPGSYMRSALSLEIHPNVSGEFLEPGIGAGLWYERGDGALRWQRVDLRVVGRHTWKALTYAARVDAATAIGSPPPLQQLLEFGENEGLPGYLYKEFGGDRALLLRANTSYELPVLRAPIRLWHRVFAPSLAPALAVGIQSGWSGASAATRTALLAFGTRTDSLSGLPLIDPATGLPELATRPSNGFRSTVSISLQLFGGAFGIGIARPLEQRSQWRLVFRAGAGL
ncbi:MAG: hypothetical protein ABI910_22210 [Gemmatimonadota bacterium]